MWKELFYFTKTERQGIIVLVVLASGAYFTPYLLQMFSKSEENTSEAQAISAESYAEFSATLKEVKPKKKYARKTLQTPYPEKEIILAPFDPNSADSATFLNLGLPSWMASNILHYRKKKGKFRRPEDFRKIYGLTEKQYETLLPYIRIAQEPSPAIKDTTQLWIASTTPPPALVKYQPGSIILELNLVDTTELKKIPGIGSAIAKMIVSHRKRLGGFYRIEQLQEIRLKADSLRQWFSIDEKQIRRININKASVERMMSHPYINFYQAKVIAEYRKKKGILKDLKQLALYEEFTPEDFERIAPYICYDL